MKLNCPGNQDGKPVRIPLSEQKATYYIPKETLKRETVRTDLLRQSEKFDRQNLQRSRLVEVTATGALLAVLIFIASIIFA